MSKAIASLLEQLPSAHISALDFCELCGSMYSHNLFYMSNWKINIKTLKHFNRSVLKLLTSKTTILMQTILTFSPIPSWNWTENISHSGGMSNNNWSHSWKATQSATEELKAAELSTHCYSGSVFANSTCEDYTKVVCTGEERSCDSTESREYFHLNIQYWNL